jgi:hypothetical protein
MIKKILEENCSNCGYLIWHDSIMFRPAAACTHKLMKKHKKSKDLEMSECLFWEPNVFGIVIVNVHVDQIGA